jgi:CubicO group peptidase (beta-lactamase class C family)
MRTGNEMSRRSEADSFSTLATLLALVTPVASACAQGDAYPGSSWEPVDDPASLGWSIEGLGQARAYADSINTAAVMIIHRGDLVAAWGETTAKFNVHSARKSLLSSMVGIYEAEGMLSLNSTLEELGIDDRLGLTESERQATVGDLLGSRSGIYHPANLVGHAASEGWPERGSHAPGTFWFYSNWDFNAMGAVFEQETSRGIFEAFEDLIAEPIGMEDYQASDGLYEPRSGWGGAQGRSVSDYPAYVFRMSARDMARFGLLYLRMGRWEDRQVVPREWVDRTTRTDRSIGDYGGHEFFWWIGIDGRLYPGVDVGDSAYAAHGAGGHYITIMPEHDMVVVHRVNTNARTIPIGGTNPGTSVSAAQYGELLERILAARG